MERSFQAYCNLSVATEICGQLIGVTGLVGGGPKTGKSKMTVCVYCNCMKVLPSAFCTVSIQKIAVSEVALAFTVTKGMFVIPPVDGIAPGLHTPGIGFASKNITVVSMMFCPLMAFSSTMLG